MSDTKTDNKITLFFVKDLNHQFGPVEKFLNKRGYNVIVATDVKMGLDQITKINPDYIFLAWDHKNENIRSMPKAIYQSCTAQVVPFIMSTQRDQIIQLEASGFENKLSPPLSGPAIIRVISKCEKKNQAFEQIRKGSTTTAKKESEMIQVKSFFTSADNQQDQINMRRSLPSATEMHEKNKAIANRNRNQTNMFSKGNSQKNWPLSSIKQEGVKAKLMQAISQEIENNDMMSAVQKQNTKNNLMSAIEKEFSSNGSQTTLMRVVETEIEQITELKPQDQSNTKLKIFAILDVQLSEAFAKTESDLDLTRDSTSAQLPKEAKKLSKGQVDFLDESFIDTIKPEMFDLIETYSDLTDNKAVLKETTQIYVLAVQELEWTGYLTLASENYLDVASAQVILNNWIKEMIRTEHVDQNSDNLVEHWDSTLFEVRIPKVNFVDLCNYKADFFKDVDYEGKKTMLAFFSFSPYQVINSIHANFDMLELSTDFLQPNQNLPFDVNLYLTENKKFILYLRPDSFLDDTQVSRLKMRKVEYIYSNMNYDLALIKYKAEFNLRILIESYNLIKASNT